ncbi:cation:dicarboxylate symporter family transporter [Helicobacter sp. MIT 14-3879]|uniref:cation:dicarboxylate symporter family transporter n=1 Tax=Helicobacter sp. MIT 14-3879 TaxID=2040649 RepID=UPI000E1EF79B|nr:cation:dicarboxylase symporter family transporter [Helicobacter sp. MIT 14-3879]RDU62075.1 sodium:dicarboxylate symporter [Helicobacter sp. MIT 14-3879]
MDSNFFSNFLVFSKYQTLIGIIILLTCFYILKKCKDKGLSFSIRMIIGLVIGIVFGVILQYISSKLDSQTISIKELKIWLGFVGSIFIGFIKMLVIPIIFISIIKVLLDIDRKIKILSLLKYSMFWILFSVAIAALIGVSLAYIFDLGLNSQSFVGEKQIREVYDISNIILGLIPSNIIDAMIKNNIVAIVIFAFFIGFGGVTLSKVEFLSDEYKTFEKLINALHYIVMSITKFVISFMPYAIVAMMAEVLLSNGFSAIWSAISFILLIYIAMILMLIVNLILVSSVGLNPFTFLKKSFSVWLFAFSSRSSVATLPFTIETLQNKLGVSGSVANFVASIGTTIGLQGCAGYFPAMVAIFIAYNIGYQIDLSFIITIVMIAIIGSLGIAGIPGSATIAASIMLTGLGFSEYFTLLSIVLAIDPIIDMARTFSNVSGAMMASVCTDKGLKTLNIDKYNT